MSATIQELDFSVDLLRAVLWQYNDAAKIQSILQQKSDWYNTNQTEFWQDWITNVFDLRTCNDFGCQVWAIILGLPLQVVTPPTNKANFGFGTFNKNFNHGNFGQLGSGIAGLTLDQKRILLQLRYRKLTSRCTVPETNKMLADLLGKYGKIYLLDPLDMSYSIYVFGFQPYSSLLFVLQNFDILPRPAAVGVKYIVSTRPVFGFGQYNRNFNHGTFAST